MKLPPLDFITPCIVIALVCAVKYKLFFVGQQSAV